MAARKSNAVATKNTEAEDFLATGKHEKDYFALVQPGFRFAANDKDVRITLRVSRKKFAGIVLALATATGVVGTGTGRIAEVAKAFRHADSQNKPTVQKVDVQPALQEGTRYEFTDQSGNKMVWTVPARPATQAAQAQLPAPAPTK